MKMIEWLPGGGTQDVSEELTKKITVVLCEWYKHGKEEDGFPGRKINIAENVFIDTWRSILSETKTAEKNIENWLYKAGRFHIKDGAREYSMCMGYRIHLVSKTVEVTIPDMVIRFGNERNYINYKLEERPEREPLAVIDLADLFDAEGAKRGV